MPPLCPRLTQSGCLRNATYTTDVPFLLPALTLRVLSNLNANSFSTKSSHYYPRNPNRGVSPLRRTGFRQELSVSKKPLPKPVLDPKLRNKIEVDPEHGLWGFFNSSKNALNTPEEDYAHGRAWTATDLRNKSWEDLHSLWWVCAKERNRIKTSSAERERLEGMFGKVEAEKRHDAVRKTQKAIKSVLRERFYAWEDARRQAAHDSSVDLSGDGPAYIEEKEGWDAEDASSRDGIGQSAQGKRAVTL